MVGNRRAGAWLTSRNSTLAGGSSRTFSSALALAGLRSSAVSTMQTRQPPLPAVEPKERYVRRTSSTRITVRSLPVLSLNGRSSTSRSGCDCAGDSARDRMIRRHRKRCCVLHPASSGSGCASTKRAMRKASVALPIPADRRSATHAESGRSDRPRAAPVRPRHGRTEPAWRADVACCLSSAAALTGSSPRVAHRRRGRRFELAIDDGPDLFRHALCVRSHRSGRSGPVR